MSDRDLRAAARYNRMMADVEARKAKAGKGKAATAAESRQQLWLQLANEIETYLDHADDQGALL